MAGANPAAIVVVVVQSQRLYPHEHMYAAPARTTPASSTPFAKSAPWDWPTVSNNSATKIRRRASRIPRSLLNTLRDANQKGLAQRGIDVTFDLLKLLHARFSRSARETGVRQIDVPQYSAIGGLTGVLREHVDHQLDALETARVGSDKLARAILERVLDTAATTRGSSADFDEIARRYEVSDDDLRTVVAGLTAPGNLLIESPPGQYQFQPPQIVAIVQEDSALRQMQRERATRIVEEGLRSRQHARDVFSLRTLRRNTQAAALPSFSTTELGSLPRAVCAARQRLRSRAPAEYWLRRVTSADDAMDILLAAAFDTSADVRARAAGLLGGISGASSFAIVSACTSH